MRLSEGTMRHRFVTVDVFTSRRFTGNPLAVFPDARGLEPGEMQRISREFNLSETTFVLPPDDARHTRRVRIFTPSAELPFAGHPTVGTAFALAHLGEVSLTGERTDIVLEEGVGPVPVTIFAKDGRPVASQLTAGRRPEVGPRPPGPHAIAAALSLDAGDLIGSPYEPEAVSCGVPFLFVPLRDRAAVARARLSRPEWERVLGTYWATEIFFFAFDPELPGSDLHARMFAPRLGVPEDPATGAAVTALGGYLGTRDAREDGTLRWVVEQGFEMGRPSLLELEIDKRGGQVVRIRVGGPSVFVSEGAMEV
jgi:trans-2,3-dihydro-3-hydroxyanthranilate isomerase